MKFCLQLNPQVAIDKPAASLLPTLIEQVRIADAVGFDAFPWAIITTFPVYNGSTRCRRSRACAPRRKTARSAQP